MRITYDADVDALYIRLIEDASEVTTRRLSEDVAIDYAPNGEVVGIEVLSARACLPPGRHSDCHP